MVVVGANVHETRLLQLTLKNVVVGRPDDVDERSEHICLYKGYDNPTEHQAGAAHVSAGHIWRIEEEKLDARGEKRYPAKSLGGGSNLGLAIEVPGDPGPF